MIHRDKTFYRLMLLTALAVVAVYLFVTAPPPLPDAKQAQQGAGVRIPVASLFTALNTISSEARRIYTAKVVGGGKEADLAFKETWTDKDVEAGPLPALFFRLMASELTKNPEPLSAFLGSDAAINPSNKFLGDQVVHFASIKIDRKPQVFADADHEQIGMFADVASAAPCVSCHNAHPASPRKDWKLNDVMGAATWIYPDAEVSAADYAKLTRNVYAAVEAAWRGYLTKAATFKDPPAIGPDWPAKGKRALPDAATFMAEVYQASAPKVLRILDDKLAPPVPKPLPTSNVKQAALEATR